MNGSPKKQSERPRELRRRVVLPARLRTGRQWSDTCILNISSRGLMIHSGRPLSQGNSVELRRGEHVIVARVVWRDGARVGLHSDERLPVEEILSFSAAQTLRLVAADGAVIERRKQPRPASDAARLRGRTLQFAGTVVIAASLAISVWIMAERAFARPLGLVVNALGAQP
jgi:hypothetical protein